MKAFWKIVAAKERVGRLQVEAEVARGRLADAQALLAKELQSAGVELDQPIHFDYDTETVVNRSKDHGRPA